jgi:hypothetical protein
MDSASIINQWIREDESVSPYEQFVGQKLDYIRDLRANWGELLIVKKPKSLSADVKPKGQWAMVVRRYLDQTGIIKVYLVQSKKFAHRLKFLRANPPDWVIRSISEMNKSTNISWQAERDSIY